jgi:hypothetical protein
MEIIPNFNFFLILNYNKKEKVIYSERSLFILRIISKYEHSRKNTRHQ